MCVFFEHVMEDVRAHRAHVDAAHQNLAQGCNVPCSIDGRGHVVLPPVVTPSVASSLFVLAGGCASVSQAARQGRRAVFTVVSDQTGQSIRQASSTSQTRQSRHLPFVRGCTATFLASDDTACQWGETRKSMIPHT